MDAHHALFLEVRVRITNESSGANTTNFDRIFETEKKWPSDEMLRMSEILAKQLRGPTG